MWYFHHLAKSTTKLIDKTKKLMDGRCNIAPTHVKRRKMVVESGQNSGPSAPSPVVGKEMRRQDLTMTKCVLHKKYFSQHIDSGCDYTLP